MYVYIYTHVEYVGSKHQGPNARGMGVELYRSLLLGLSGFEGYRSFRVFWAICGERLGFEVFEFTVRGFICVQVRLCQVPRFLRAGSSSRLCMYSAGIVIFLGALYRFVAGFQVAYQIEILIGFVARKKRLQ